MCATATARVYMAELARVVFAGRWGKNTSIHEHDTLVLISFFTNLPFQSVKQ